MIGSGISKASGAPDARRIRVWGRRHILLLGIVPLLAWLEPLYGKQAPPAAEAGVSKPAAERCAEKLARLEEFASRKNGDGSRTTRFTETEVNSYLALEVSRQYHPSLKSVTFTFEESRLGCLALVDFDRLEMSSTQFVTQILAKMFSGVHALRISGQLVAEGGQAYFRLGDARFDSTTLPNFLVEEIVSTVGRKQKPPFDPMKPSDMPYKIRRVEVHSGFITVLQ